MAKARENSVVLFFDNFDVACLARLMSIPEHFAQCDLVVHGCLRLQGFGVILSPTLRLLYSAALALLLYCLTSRLTALHSPR